jgi:plastocyanin
VRKTRVALALLVAGMATGSLVAPWSKPVVADDDNHNRKMTLRDDCDPTDPTWAPTGGCALEKGDVNRAEFNGELMSPLSLSVIGHQAWRIDPSYRKVEADDTLRVRNRGGRTHTFTEVRNFGGGRIPPLNQGLIMAPECATATDIPAGASANVSGLSVGNHRFQCCIHPWMRAIVKVKAEKED